MSKPQLSFPCHNRTPKHHGCLNTLHQTLGDEFKSCWGRVEEFLADGEQKIAHTKPFFFPVASAATCTDSHLEVDQRNLHNSYTQLQWLAISGKLCKKQWQDSHRPYKMWFRLETRLLQLGTESVICTRILGATSAHLPNVGKLEWAGYLEIFQGKYFSERVKEKKAAEFAALKQKGMSVAEYEAQFAWLAVYAPHLEGTERLKANWFMDGLRPIFIEKLGPHNIQTYAEMVQRAQLVEDTMAKVDAIQGPGIALPRGDVIP
ncbi:hypothetical protein Taro_024884 [Colocasia esculenta]|uniref:Retrotransposon gag domain-containing protein n=1 Tax=Colocasia esculenta TaxID=4460 RepID=A0A843VIT4_COLES|nr:hypothetical protein [Colocasia esculenta]